MSITIHKSIEIKAPAERVWRYVGTEAGLRQWWGLNIDMEAKQGGRCEERSLFNGKPLALAGEVLVYDPPRQLVLFLRQPEEVATWPAFITITITLKEQNARTVVTLEHHAVGSLPVEAAPGWAVRQVQAPVSERQVIVNQLPVAGLSTTRPTGYHSTYSVEQIWLRDYAVRYESYLDKLQQITSETGENQAS